MHRILLALFDPEDPRILLPLLRSTGRSRNTRVSVMQSSPFVETLIEMPQELSPRPHSDEEAAEVSVDAFVAALNDEGLAADGFTSIGRSPLMIAAAAERIEATLILLVFRHPGRLEALLRITPVPVLAVPVGPGRPSARILVPIEDAGSLEVVPVAAVTARELGAELSFVVSSEGHPWLPRAHELAYGEGLPTEGAVLTTELATTLLELAAAMIVIKWSPRPLVNRLLRETKVPLFLVRHPPPLPDRAPINLSQVPAAMWTRKIHANPLQGIGDL